MPSKKSRISRTPLVPTGYTLIELLVVIAIIALLLAIILPSLRMVKSHAQRLTCQSNLRQITLGWTLYLNDHEGRFYQAVNINHDFGGWKGTGSFALYRPLNPFLNLPAELESGESLSRVFLPGRFRQDPRTSADRKGLGIFRQQLPDKYTPDWP